MAISVQVIGMGSVRVEGCRHEVLGSPNWGQDLIVTLKGREVRFLNSEIEWANSTGRSRTSASYRIRRDSETALAKFEELSRL